MLRPGLAVIPMADAIQLRAGDEQIILLHSPAPQQLFELLKLLDGRHRIDELVDKTDLGGRGAIDLVLEHLASNNLLAATNGKPDELVRYLGHTVNDADEVVQQLRNRSVVILGSNPGVSLMVSMLGECGIDAGQYRSWPQVNQKPNADGSVPKGVPDVAVCIWEQPDRTQVTAINESACHSGTPCLFVNMSHGQHASIGPFFVPGQGACYQCLIARLYENTTGYRELQATDAFMDQTGQALAGYGVMPPHRHWVIAVACGELIAYLTGHRALGTLNSTLTLDLEQSQMCRQPVWQVPWCPQCGDASS